MAKERAKVWRETKEWFWLKTKRDLKSIKGGDEQKWLAHIKEPHETTGHGNQPQMENTNTTTNVKGKKKIRRTKNV